MEFVMKPNHMYACASIALCIATQAQQQEATDSHNLHLYFLAQYKTAEGALREASSYFDQLISKKQTPWAAYKGYVQFLALTSQYSRILNLIDKLDKMYPDDPAVQMAIVEALEQSDRQQESVDRLIRLAQKNITNQEVALKTVHAYLARQEPENAINVIDNYVDNAIHKPNLFMFYFLKTQILIQLDKKQLARDEIKKCLKAQSHFDKGWLVYAMLEEQLGNLQGAIEGFSTFLDLVGHNNAVAHHLMQLMFKQKMLEDKTDTLTMSESCFKQALLLFQQKRHREALQRVEECLKKNDKDPEARLLKIQILNTLNRKDAVLASLIDWMREDPRQDLWFSTLLLMTGHGITHTEAIRALHIVEKHSPNTLLPVQYLADLYLRVEQTAQALEYLKKVTVLSSDKLLRAKAFYQMSRIFFQEKRFNDIHKALEQGLSAAPNFAPLCNLKAYYCAKQGNIALAQEYIAQALRQDPGNPHYQDTQGYIYYKKHDYARAASLIDQLANNNPDDQCIRKHADKIRSKMAKPIQ
jgi:tetratricopeptide (TPR) repeat protein